MKKMPQSLHPPKDEENTRKKELEKAYERIGILETRVHDLTLQVAVVGNCKFIKVNRIHTSLVDVCRKESVLYFTV